MEIIIDQKELFKALQRIQGVVDTKGAIPILSHVLIEATGEEIWIFATDLKIGIKGLYSGTIIEEGLITLPAKKLFDIVKELPNAGVKISCEKSIAEQVEDNWVYISSGKYNSRLPSMPADIFPAFPSYGEDFLISFEPSQLKDMVRKTIFSISGDESRMALNGTFLEMEDDSVVMVSTDGHRLSYAKMKNVKKVETKNSIILPQKTSGELLKFSEHTDEPILFGIYENHAVFRKCNLTLVSRLIEEGQFPSYDAVIPPIGDSFITIEKDALAGALKRVSPLSEEKSRMVKFSFRTGELEIIADATDMGDAREILPVEGNIDSILIGLNAKYVLDILNVTDKSEINIFINNSKSPALFMQKDETDYKCVIMPMRVSEQN